METGPNNTQRLWLDESRLVPQPVTELASTALEWPRLLALVGGFASSPVGHAWIAALVPSRDAAWLRAQHGLVAEMQQIVAAGVSIPLAGLFDPKDLLDKSNIPGAALEAEELRALIALMNDLSGWQGLMKSPPADVNIPALIALSAPMMAGDLRPLLEVLAAKIMPDGTLADNASSELRRIRQDQLRQKRAIEESLRSALRKLSSQTQDNLITIRGDRFVIPIKVEEKRRISGVVHGASSSGQTVYVEPLETIEENNELVRLIEEEQAEIHRIFVALTRQIAEHSEAIRAGAGVLAIVDSLLARARFGREYQCTRPAFDAENLSLAEARHPLLEKRLRAEGGKIVPLTLALTGSERQLILSGPNTGGKTVALKTAALLAMMAQSGIPVPATAASFPIFSGFLADIGDAQSIEQGLSAFSAHIVNLDRIARIAEADSLVLLDELGSATDPEEGAALAVAIAAYFLERRAWTILSTHHTSLKVFGANTPGVRNAAVGVEEVTLLPNYTLRMGVPGISAGIQTAERLGLATEIITAARARLGSQAVDIARFLDELHRQLELTETKHRQVLLREAEAAKLKEKLEREGLTEMRNRTRELEAKLNALLKDFEYQARETVKLVEDRAAQQKLSKEAERRIARMRREFQESFNSAVVAHNTGADKGDPNATPHLLSHVAVGDTVKLRKLGKTGQVVRAIDANIFEVAVGPMKMRVSRSDMSEVTSAPIAAAPQSPLRAMAGRRGVTVQMSGDADSLASEINVIGRTAEEAREEVERYLDRAFLAGLPRIRIVHGTGMGVLRRTLRQWLTTHPQVETVTEPPQNEGGQGATVVELKQ